jgi:hypothetical protein
MRRTFFGAPLGNKVRPDHGEAILDFGVHLPSDHF